MEFERYEDVIDAFDRDNMGYDTLTDYIKGENIKIMAGRQYKYSSCATRRSSGNSYLALKALSNITL